MEMTHSSCTCLWPPCHGGRGTALLEWQSPWELLHVTEEAVLSQLQTQQLPGRPGSRQPTRKTLRVLLMPQSTNPFVSLVLFLLRHPMVWKKGVAAHTAARGCTVWRQGIAFLHFPTLQERRLNRAHSFHHHDHGKNSCLGLKPKTLTIQKPLNSGHGQCYQLGLLIENVLLFWRRPIFPLLAPSMEVKTSRQVSSHPLTPALLHPGAEAWMAPIYFPGPHPPLGAGLGPARVCFPAS